MGQDRQAIEAEICDFRDEYLQKGGVFVGTVEALEGAMGKDGRRSGAVVLSLMLPDEGETVRTKVLLSADDYELAHGLHVDAFAYVRVAGRLGPGRLPKRLTCVSSFVALAVE